MLEYLKSRCTVSGIHRQCWALIASRIMSLVVHFATSITSADVEHPLPFKRDYNSVCQDMTTVAHPATLNRQAGRGLVNPEDEPSRQMKAMRAARPSLGGK